jgi:hypothetical protein
MKIISGDNKFFRTTNYVISMLIVFFVFSCKTVAVKREIKKVQEIATISPTHKFIKSHMKDGTVYILHDWHFDEINNSIWGYGSLLGINRNVIETRDNKINKVNLFTISLSEVALIETNDTGSSIAGGLAVVTGLIGVFAILCITNPKACFGSCPTFYANNGDTLAIQAEGFSTSVSPSLEKNDIDMLYSAKPNRNFELVVTNEALETHSIRYANLLAFEITGDERVFADPYGSFYKCIDFLKPTSCENIKGDCLKKIADVDGDEYFSQTDSSNLNSKEELILNFRTNKNERVGLIIGKRQTLLTTFLMYQGLSYMGNSVTYWMAEFERGKIVKKQGIFDLLGGIKVYSKNSIGDWKFEGEINETGPIATDFNIIPLSVQVNENVELKLVLNKGLWRIDYLALSTLTEKVMPRLVEPSNVETITGSETYPLEKLKNRHEYLVTYPGDVYKIEYELPFINAELFLDSKGYYLEWIRDEWVKEQNFKKLDLMINNPALFLKKAASQFKKLEPQMEQTFWNSRYVKK